MGERMKPSHIKIMEDADERWVYVPWTNAYQVSSKGNVRSLYFKNKRCNKKRITPLILSKTKINGYLFSTIRVNNKSKNIPISRLMLLSFIGNPPTAEYQAAHLNGIRTDNRLENLSWVTRTENEQHKELHGTRSRGENHHSSKLTEKDVLKIRKLSIYKEQLEIAKMFKIDQTNVSAIVLRKTWKHI